jgi:tetratricopeptide (TPR) repeat protein
VAVTSVPEGGLDEARAGYLSVLESNPDDVDALTALGQLSLKQGNASAALDYLQRATSLEPGRAGLACKVAQLLRGLDRVDEARAAYLSVVKAEPNNIIALAGLGQLSRKAGDALAALDYLQRATSLAPANLGLQCECAQLLRGLDRVDEARAAYLFVLKADPNNVIALAGLGQLSRQAGDALAALDYLQRATSLAPANLGLQCECAQLLRGLDRVDEARAAYLFVLKADPNNVAALAGLGHLSRQAGDTPAALDYLQRAASLAPANLGLRCESAQLLRALNRFDEARATYLTVLQSNPANIGALTEMGLIERQRGDHAASLEFLEKALASRPTSVGLMTEVAATLRILERADEAEALYRRAVETDPRSLASLRGVCQMSFARGQIDAAIEFARAACAVDPKNIDSKLFLSSLYRDAARNAEALAIVEDLLAAAPDHSSSWLEYGSLLRDRGDRAQALSAFQRAAELKHERAWLDVATEHLALGQTQKARQVYDTVLQANPRQFDALMGVAAMQALTGDYFTCLETCDLVIATYPKRLEPVRQRCQALVQLDRADEAVKMATGLDTSGPLLGHGNAIRLEIYRMCGLRAQARELLADARVADSKFFPLWFQNVQARLAFYDLDGAEAALEDPPALRPHEHARALLAQGMLADRRWRVRDAIAAFERALGVQGHDPGVHENLARLYLLEANPDRVAHHLECMLAQRASSLSLRGQSKNISQNMIGQLLNELKLDRALSGRLAGLLERAPQDRIEELCKIVRSEPGPTPPAIYLMLTLRQHGAFEYASPAEAVARASNSSIPAKIMQFWDRSRPPTAVSKLLRTWSDAHPDHDYHRFDKGSARTYLAANYPIEVGRAFHRASHPAQASDIFRLAYLLREGGFYVDADDRCVGHLSSVAAANLQFIAYQEQFASLGNNFIGCVPDEPIIKHALNLAVEAMNRGDSEAIWLSTGPGVLTRAFAEVFAAQGKAWQEWLQNRRILDRRRLFDVSWPHSILNYKNTRLSWLHRVFKSRSVAPAG